MMQYLHQDHSNSISNVKYIYNESIDIQDGYEIQEHKNVSHQGIQFSKPQIQICDFILKLCVG